MKNDSSDLGPSDSSKNLCLKNLMHMEHEQLLSHPSTSVELRELQRVGSDHDPHWSQGPKTLKFFNFCRQLSLGNLFGILGRTIGTYPFAFCIATLILSSSSLGLYKMKLQDRVKDGYTPSTSPSRYETDVFREFLGSDGDPIMTTVLFRAKDGGSMHRFEYLEEVVHIHRFIRSNLSFEYAAPGEPIERVKFEDICGLFCDSNVAIDYFTDALRDEIKRIKTGKNRSTNTNLSYPIALLSGYELHLERNFYGVEQENDSDSIIDSDFHNVSTGNGNDTQINLVTPIRYIKAVVMVFRGDIARKGDVLRMAQWEMALYKYSREKFSSNRLEFLMLGSEIVDYEMNQDAQKTVPYFAIGFSAMLLFVFATVLISSLFYGVFDSLKFLLAFATTLCPVLAIVSTFGILSIVEMRTNTIMLIMPFLIMGIGVNDAFLMIHSWHRTSKQGIPVPVRIGLVLEDVGPSITITTLTNVITFSIGSLTPTPEIQLFCIATATALGFAYIYTLVFFVPIMCLASVYENRNVYSRSDKVSKNHTKEDIFLKITQFYINILQNKFFTYSLLIGVLVYWYFAILGTLTIKSKLDTEKILPKDTPIRVPHEQIMRLVWNEYYPVSIFVNSPLDIRKKDKLDRFDSMLDEFENMPLCKGKMFTNIWLRDYIKYCKEYEFDFDYYSENGATETTKATTQATETGFDYKRLNEFLSSPIYKHYKAFIRLKNITNIEKDDVPIEKFMFIVTFHNTSSNWDQRIQLMQDWRAIADKYKDGLNVTVWETNGMFVDQMLSLKRLTLMTCLITLGCMTVVCGVFIQNPLSVLTATFAILSISLGVIGYLSWWHLDLDPVTMAAVLMSIGMSVDFTAHVAYHFQLSEQSEIRDGKILKIPLLTQNDKLEHTLKAVAWPMTQAGISTVISILPLICLQNYIPLVFVKTISLVVIWGLFHGLVLLPAFLVVMPRKWLEANCYRAIFDKATASAMYDMNDSKPDEAKTGLTKNQDLGNEQHSVDNFSKLNKSTESAHSS